jgi:glutamate/aspartate transport system substrate-binding protein
MGLSLGIAVGVLALVAAPTGAQEVRPTLDKIKETGVINLGYRETSAPFSFVDKDGKPAGYSIDLCTYVAETIRSTVGLGQIRINWVPETPANRIQQLVRGVTDLGCGSTTITFARMEQVDFSHMTFVDGGSLLATADSGIAAVKDLGGKRVG